MFAITRFRCIEFFSIYFTITGARKIVRYTEDFVIKRFVKSRFHCIQNKPSVLNTDNLD